MIGPLFVLLGLGCALIGWLLLRRSGSGWRIGRLLAAAPQHSLEEASAMATAGQEAYVRLHGRIDSDEEFPGDGDRPVVFRRRRLEQDAGRSGWQAFDDERLAVPFGLRERGQRVAIDADALGDGLVVVPRISTGVASDLTDQATTGPLPQLPPDTPVRLRLEQVSSLDHATAAGVPRLEAGGEVVLGPGLGRPLVLTNLALDEAMRVLGSNGRTRLLAATVLGVAAAILAVLGVILVIAGW